MLCEVHCPRLKADKREIGQKRLKEVIVSSGLQCRSLFGVRVELHVVACEQVFELAQGLCLRYQPQVSASGTIVLGFFEPDSINGLGLARLTRLARQQVPGIYSSNPPQCRFGVFSRPGLWGLQ